MCLGQAPNQSGLSGPSGGTVKALVQKALAVWLLARAPGCGTAAPLVLSPRLQATGQQPVGGLSLFGSGFPRAGSLTIGAFHPS